MKKHDSQNHKGHPRVLAESEDGEKQGCNHHNSPTNKKSLVCENSILDIMALHHRNQAISNYGFVLTVVINL